MQQTPSMAIKKSVLDSFSLLHLTTESGKPDSCFLYPCSTSRWGSMSPSFGQWDLRESLLKDSGKDNLVPFNRNVGGDRFFPWPPCPSWLWMRSCCLERQQPSFRQDISLSLKATQRISTRWKQPGSLRNCSYNCVPPGFLLLEGNKSLLVKVLLVHFSNTCKLKHS